MLDIITTDLLRILIIIPILIYASYTDIKERRVEDKVWSIPTFIALILLGWDAYTSSNPVGVGLAALFSLVTIGGLAYIIYYFRIFYGADYKAFLLIAILFPWHPDVGSLPLYDYILIQNVSEVFTMGLFDNLFEILLIYSAITLFGFTVFVNTTLFSVIYFITNAKYNIQNNTFSITKPLRSFTARQVNVSELDNMHAQIVDETESNNKIFQGFEFIRNGLHGLSTDFFRDYEQWYSDNKTVSQNVDINDIDDLEFDSFLEDNEEWESTNPKEDEKNIKDILDKDKVWVTPGVPFIVPITFGVISALVVGNLIYFTLSLL